MANPTTYFGWVMPNSADLVTDLPADFNVFGQGVDTSMQYLLGGTTGQVLSKTSGTNMAFTWVTPTDQTPLTTKGDLFTFTTVDARLAVGANDTALVADSTQSTGLAYKTKGVFNGLTTTGDTIYSSSGTTQSRLGIGSTGQVLTVASGIPSWATPASSGGMTLLSTTSMSGTSTTVSSISGAYTNLLIVLYGLSPASTTSAAYVYPNGSSTISDSSFSTAYGSTSTTEANKAAGILWNGGQNFLGGNTNNGASILIYNYANTNIAYKTFSFQGRSTGNLSPSTLISAGGGAIATSSAITSLQFGIGSVTTTGTILIYGVN